MKQKRRTYQASDVGKNIQPQPSTTASGTRDAGQKVRSTETDCASGVCSVTWKPDSHKC